MPVYLAAMGGCYSEVSRNSIASFHLYEISSHDLLGVNLHLLSFTDHQRLLCVERMLFRRVLYLDSDCAMPLE